MVAKSRPTSGSPTLTSRYLTGKLCLRCLKAKVRRRRFSQPQFPADNELQTFRGAAWRSTPRRSRCESVRRQQRRKVRSSTSLSLTPWLMRALADVVNQLTIQRHRKPGQAFLHAMFRCVRSHLCLARLRLTCLSLAVRSKSAPTSCTPTRRTTRSRRSIRTSTGRCSSSHSSFRRTCRSGERIRGARLASSTVRLRTHFDDVLD